MFSAAILVFFASAQETENVQEPDNSCRQESFVNEPSFQVGEITTPALLLRDDGTCPIMEDAQCLKGGELASGSEVLVAHRYHSLACVWFQPPDEVEKVGWIPGSSLKVKAPQPPNESWTGDWNDHGRNWLYIDASPGTSQLRIAGHARWYGTVRDVRSSYSAASRARGTARPPAYRPYGPPRRGGSHGVVPVLAGSGICDRLGPDH
jgi:hypothetical protein